MFKQGGPGSGGVLPERGSEEDVVDDGVHPPVHLNDRVEQILDQGYTIFEDFCTEQEIADIRHAFNTEVPITQMAAIGTETGLTLRAHNLLAKTRACDWLFLDPRLRKLVKGVLGPLVQVNVTTLFNTLPGETRQFLHQDDGLWPIARPHPSFICNALLAIDDFDEEVGATHIVPYSHKMNDVVPHNKHPDEIQVKMKSGSMIMWEGGLWHGGGANTTSVEAGNYRERMGFFMSHSVGYLRPQEIQVTLLLMTVLASWAVSSHRRRAVLFSSSPSRGRSCSRCPSCCSACSATTASASASTAATRWTCWRTAMRLRHTGARTRGWRTSSRPMPTAAGCELRMNERRSAQVAQRFLPS